MLPQFSATDPPRGIVDQAGNYLADTLQGFSWSRSAQRLSGPTVNGQRLSLRFQSSTWSRTGSGTWVDVHVTVHDAGLRRWRRANLEVALRSDDWLFFNGLHNFVDGLRAFELFGPLKAEEPDRYSSLEDLERSITDHLLPTSQTLKTPPDAAASLPDRWLSRPMYLVEWAVARHEFDAARRPITRSLDLHPAWLPAFERGYASASRGQKPDPNNTVEPFGAAVHRFSQMMGDSLWNGTI